MAAADVRHAGAALELLHHAVERGEPLGDEAGAVVGGERSLHAVEQVVGVLVPADAAAVDEAVGEAVAAVGGRRGGQEHAGEGERARLVGEHEGVLGRERVRVLLRVVGHVAAGGLVVEPLADVALLRAGAARELGGGDGLAVGHRAVEAETVSDGDQGGAHGGADVRGDLVDEGLDLGLVDGGEDAHAGTVSPRSARSLRRR